MAVFRFNHPVGEAVHCNRHGRSGFDSRSDISDIAANQRLANGNRRDVSSCRLNRIVYNLNFTLRKLRIWIGLKS